MSGGLKYDNNKLCWDLLPYNAITEIVKIYNYVVQKYEENSWQNVDLERYFAALMRHLVAWRGGEKRDKESGELHLAHAGWNILALIWNELQKRRNQ